MMNNYRQKLIEMKYQHRPTVMKILTTTAVTTTSEGT
jgi:hypothetical protein